MTGSGRLRPRRILLVETNDDGTTGGSYQCLFELARHMDRSRFEPVALFYHENSFAGRLREAGILVHIWNPTLRPDTDAGETPEPAGRRLRRKLAAITRRARFIRRERIALVHLNNSPAAGCTDWLPAARLAQVPCLTHARAEVPRRKGWFRTYWLRRFDRVIAISRHIETAMWRAGISPKRVVQIYDGIDADRFRAGIKRPPPEVRRELGVPDGRLLVVLVGHLRAWKGQDLALRALARLDRRIRHRLYLLFVGPTARSAASYRAELDRLVADLSLGADVGFAGERSEVAEIMNAADVVLHASTIPEPFGLVVLEGLALGKPVVAAQLGGPAEIITPGTGILFDPGDPAALAAALTLVVERPEIARSFAGAARNRAEEFPVTRTVTAVEQVYRELLRDRFPVISRLGASPPDARSS